MRRRVNLSRQSIKSISLSAIFSTYATLTVIFTKHSTEIVFFHVRVTSMPGKQKSLTYTAKLKTETL